jgi:hypothetical protein
MDRSKFILAKDCGAVNSEARKTCCDSLMLAANDYEQVNCEKYGYRPEWITHANIFQKNMINCFRFKREGKCCLANVM